ncbi:MAG: hypothetical protein R2851_12335 [Caldilineaceae bacterium]
MLGTLNRLLDDAAKRAGIALDQIVKAMTGNSTMILLLLRPAASIDPAHAPFITTVNQPPPFPAGDLDLHMHPRHGGLSPRRGQLRGCGHRKRAWSVRAWRARTRSPSSWMWAPTARPPWAQATGC